MSQEYCNCESKERYDNFGNKIIHHNKKHRITLISDKPEIIVVENWKKYNESAVCDKENCNETNEII